MTSSFVLSVTTFIYAIPAVSYIAAWIFNSKRLAQFAFGVGILAVLGNITGFILRWIETYKIGYGHVPLSNLYESLVFFALTIAIICLFMEWKYKTPQINAFAMPIAFLAIAYAALKGGSSEIQPLIPALKSNWLTVHVLTCFLGYAGFAVAFGISLIYLLKRSFSFAFFLGCIVSGIYYLVYSLIIGFFCYKTIQVKSSLPNFIAELPDSIIIGSTLIILSVSLLLVIMRLVNSNAGETHDNKGGLALPVLDELTRQTIMFGFLFLSLGIITGSVWANSAWGSYWSWDPKETWSLITWFVYAIFLHLKYMRDWSGTRLAIISVIGFMAVMFTYFGVNYLPGLHSYAQ